MNTVYAAVANYHGPSAMYRCNNIVNAGEFSLALDTSTVVHLNIEGASSMTMFFMGTSQYLLISTFFDGLTPLRSSPSVLYRVSVSTQGLISAAVMQELSGAYASDVTHFLHGGFIHAVFAVNHNVLPSFRFSANLAEYPATNESPTLSRMNILRKYDTFASTVPTKYASSVSVFFCVACRDGRNEHIPL